MIVHNGRRIDPQSATLFGPQIIVAVHGSILSGTREVFDLILPIAHGPPRPSPFAAVQQAIGDM